MWKPKESAPKTGEWIVVINNSHPFTVRYFNPFPADPNLIDFRDERGKVRPFTKWQPICGH